MCTIALMLACSPWLGTGRRLKHTQSSRASRAISSVVDSTEVASTWVPVKSRSLDPLHTLVTLLLAFDVKAAFTAASCLSWESCLGFRFSFQAARFSNAVSSVDGSDSEAESLKRVAAENGEVLPQSYFEQLKYDEGGVPWDLCGRPQPPVRNAAQDGAFGPKGTAILDCGCGAGDNANWLAMNGYRIFGFDLSPSAVTTARERAASSEVASVVEQANGSVAFAEASATDLGSADRVQTWARDLDGFGVVLDSALLHCLDDEAQQTYLDGVRQLMRPGGKMFVGCFSDANPDPWSNPRRISRERLQALFSKKRGWRLVDLKEAWYERPADRTASRGGAWTMAWWCSAELSAEALPPAALEIAPGIFPVPDTSPKEVVVAQLEALRRGDIQRVFKLFSRARRLAIEEGVRIDERERNLPPERVHSALALWLRRNCPGLIAHRSFDIVASLEDPFPQPGHLQKWTYRVKVNEGEQHFIFTLTRQSDFDGGDRRDYDGFECCWFVWQIKLDDGDSNPETDPNPSDRVPVLA
mmetsp:Transcript_11987/g.22460  ORF Transcript_11987/g.22460 Transcript_11987/m.22460 type:complete len:528 (+) Transcript_11987:60-1643(+)